MAAKPPTSEALLGLQNPEEGALSPMQWENIYRDKTGANDAAYGESREAARGFWPREPQTRRPGTGQR